MSATMEGTLVVGCIAHTPNISSNLGEELSAHLVLQGCRVPAASSPISKVSVDAAEGLKPGVMGVPDDLTMTAPCNVS
jgi:hypothetical protein